MSKTPPLGQVELKRLKRAGVLIRARALLLGPRDQAFNARHAIIREYYRRIDEVFA